MSPEIEFLTHSGYCPGILGPKRPVLGPNQTKAGKFLRILGLDRTRTCENFDTSGRSAHGPKRKLKILELFGPIGSRT